METSDELAYFDGCRAPEDEVGDRAAYQGAWCLRRNLQDRRCPHHQEGARGRLIAGRLVTRNGPEGLERSLANNQLLRGRHFYIDACSTPPFDSLRREAYRYASVLPRPSLGRTVKTMGICIGAPHVEICFRSSSAHRLCGERARGKRDRHCGLAGQLAALRAHARPRACAHVVALPSDGRCDDLRRAARHDVHPSAVLLPAERNDRQLPAGNVEHRIDEAVRRDANEAPRVYISGRSLFSACIFPPLAEPPWADSMSRISERSFSCVETGGASGSVASCRSSRAPALRHALFEKNTK